MEDNDRESGLRLAHTLKGVAGNIGAKSLQAAAGDVEKAIKDSKINGIEEVLDVMAHQTDSIMENLKDFIVQTRTSKEAKTENKKQGNQDILLDLLNELKPHIQKQKPKFAKEIMAKISSYDWEQIYGEPILQMDKLLKKFKFKDVLPVLDELISKIKQRENFVFNELYKKRDK